MSFLPGRTVSGSKGLQNRLKLSHWSSKRAKRSGNRFVVATFVIFKLVERPATKWRMIGTALGAGLGLAIAIPVLAETHNEGSGNYDGAAAGLIVGLAAVGLLTGWRADHTRDVVRLLPD